MGQTASAAAAAFLCYIKKVGWKRHSRSLSDVRARRVVGERGVPAQDAREGVRALGPVEVVLLPLDEDDRRRVRAERDEALVVPLAQLRAALPHARGHVVVAALLLQAHVAEVVLALVVHQAALVAQEVVLARDVLQARLVHVLVRLVHAVHRVAARRDGVGRRHEADVDVLHQPAELGVALQERLVQHLEEHLVVRTLTHAGHLHGELVRARVLVRRRGGPQRYLFADGRGVAHGAAVELHRNVGNVDAVASAVGGELVDVVCRRGECALCLLPIDKNG